MVTARWMRHTPGPSPTSADGDVAGPEVGAGSRNSSDDLGCPVDDDAGRVLGHGGAGELLRRLVPADEDDLVAGVAQAPSEGAGGCVITLGTHDDPLYGHGTDAVTRVKGVTSGASSRGEDGH